MIITRGLGSNFLVTWGYGGVALVAIDPYCPGVPWWVLATPSQAVATTIFTPASSKVVAGNSPFSAASSPTLPASRAYSPTQSPFSRGSGAVGQGSSVISKSQSPFTKPPKACGA